MNSTINNFLSQFMSSATLPQAGSGQTVTLTNDDLTDEQRQEIIKQENQDCFDGKASCENDPTGLEGTVKFVANAALPASAIVDKDHYYANPLRDHLGFYDALVKTMGGDPSREKFTMEDGITGAYGSVVPQLLTVQGNFTFGDGFLNILRGEPLVYFVNGLHLYAVNGGWIDIDATYLGVNNEGIANLFLTPVFANWIEGGVVNRYLPDLGKIFPVGIDKINDPNKNYYDSNTKVDERFHLVDRIRRENIPTRVGVSAIMYLLGQLEVSENKPQDYPGIDVKIDKDPLKIIKYLDAQIDLKNEKSTLTLPPVGHIPSVTIQKEGPIHVKVDVKAKNEAARNDRIASNSNAFNIIPGAFTDYLLSKKYTTVTLFHPLTGLPEKDINGNTLEYKIDDPVWMNDLMTSQNLSKEEVWDTIQKNAFITEDGDLLVHRTLKNCTSEIRTDSIGIRFSKVTKPSTLNATFDIQASEIQSLKIGDNIPMDFPLDLELTGSVDASGHPKKLDPLLWDADVKLDGHVTIDDTLYTPAMQFSNVKIGGENRNIIIPEATIPLIDGETHHVKAKDFELHLKDGKLTSEGSLEINVSAEKIKFTPPFPFIEDLFGKIPDIEETRLNVDLKTNEDQSIDLKVNVSTGINTTEETLKLPFDIKDLAVSISDFNTHIDSVPLDANDPNSPRVLPVESILATHTGKIDARVEAKIGDNKFDIDNLSIDLGKNARSLTDIAALTNSSVVSPTIELDATIETPFGTLKTEPKIQLTSLADADFKNQTVDSLVHNAFIDLSGTSFDSKLLDVNLGTAFVSMPQADTKINLATGDISHEGSLSLKAEHSDFGPLKDLNVDVAMTNVADVNMTTLDGNVQSISKATTEIPFDFSIFKGAVTLAVYNDVALEKKQDDVTASVISDATVGLDSTIFGVDLDGSLNIKANVAATGNIASMEAAAGINANAFGSFILKNDSSIAAQIRVQAKTENHLTVKESLNNLAANSKINILSDISGTAGPISGQVIIDGNVEFSEGAERSAFIPDLTIDVDAKIKNGPKIKTRLTPGEKIENYEPGVEFVATKDGIGFGQTGRAAMNFKLEETVITVPFLGTQERVAISGQFIGDSDLVNTSENPLLPMYMPRSGSIKGKLVNTEIRLLGHGGMKVAENVSFEIADDGNGNLKIKGNLESPVFGIKEVDIPITLNLSKKVLAQTANKKFTTETVEGSCEAPQVASYHYYDLLADNKLGFAAAIEAVHEKFGAAFMNINGTATVAASPKVNFSGKMGLKEDITIKPTKNMSVKVSKPMIDITSGSLSRVDSKLRVPLSTEVRWVVKDGDETVEYYLPLRSRSAIDSTLLLDTGKLRAKPTQIKLSGPLSITRKAKDGTVLSTVKTQVSATTHLKSFSGKVLDGSDLINARFELDSVVLEGELQDELKLPKGIKFSPGSLIRLPLKNLAGNLSIQYKNGKLSAKGSDFRLPQIDESMPLEIAFPGSPFKDFEMLPLEGDLNIKTTLNPNGQEVSIKADPTGATVQAETPTAKINYGSSIDLGNGKDQPVKIAASGETSLDGFNASYNFQTGLVSAEMTGFQLLNMLDGDVKISGAHFDVNDIDTQFAFKKMDVKFNPVTGFIKIDLDAPEIGEEIAPPKTMEEWLAWTTEEKKAYRKALAERPHLAVLPEKMGTLPGLTYRPGGGKIYVDTKPIHYASDLKTYKEKLEKTLSAFVQEQQLASGDPTKVISSIDDYFVEAKVEPLIQKGLRDFYQKAPADKVKQDPRAALEEHLKNIEPMDFIMLAMKDAIEVAGSNLIQRREFEPPPLPNPLPKDYGPKDSLIYDKEEGVLYFVNNPNNSRILDLVGGAAGDALGNFYFANRTLRIASLAKSNFFNKYFEEATLKSLADTTIVDEESDTSFDQFTSNRGERFLWKLRTIRKNLAGMVNIKKEKLAKGETPSRELHPVAFSDVYDIGKQNPNEGFLNVMFGWYSPVAADQLAPIYSDVEHYSNWMEQITDSEKTGNNEYKLEINDNLDIPVTSSVKNENGVQVIQVVSNSNSENGSLAQKTTLIPLKKAGCIVIEEHARDFPGEDLDQYEDYNFTYSAALDPQMAGFYKVIEGKDENGQPKNDIQIPNFDAIGEVQKNRLHPETNPVELLGKIVERTNRNIFAMMSKGDTPASTSVKDDAKLREDLIYRRQNTVMATPPQEFISWVTKDETGKDLEKPILKFVYDSSKPGTKDAAIKLMIRSLDISEGIANEWISKGEIPLKDIANLPFVQKYFDEEAALGLIEMIMKIPQLNGNFNLAGPMLMTTLHHIRLRMDQWDKKIEFYRFSGAFFNPDKNNDDLTDTVSSATYAVYPSGYALDDLLKIYSHPENYDKVSPDFPTDVQDPSIIPANPSRRHVNLTLSLGPIGNIMYGVEVPKTDTLKINSKVGFAPWWPTFRPGISEQGMKQNEGFFIIVEMKDGRKFVDRIGNVNTVKGGDSTAADIAFSKYPVFASGIHREVYKQLKPGETPTPLEFKPGPLLNKLSEFQ